VETVTVPARNAEVHAAAHGSELSFDLEMPSRAYSGVELRLGGEDFVGVAHVTAPQVGGKSEDLGTFTVFDLSGRHLGRSTTLALAETTAPTLHVELRLTQPDGRPWRELAAGVIQGATVPPSREAQVLYTVVAQSAPTMQLNDKTVVLFPQVPEHVPVERVSVVLKPEAPANFLHRVMVVSRAAKGAGAGAGTAVADETLQGTVARVTMAAQGDVPAIHYERLQVGATLGATLSSAAEVEVAVDHGGEGPLPIAAVALEMRQRSLCFEAAANERYILRYGDAGLGAPHYGDARELVATGQAERAELGPEELNAQYSPRVESRSYGQRHPEAVWVGLLGAIAVVVLAALESVKRQRHR
jgi:hypothetical protein